MLAVVCVGHMLPGQAVAEIVPEPITLFTHGETTLARRDVRGQFSGPAIDTFICVMNNMQQPHAIRHAPLSRAMSIIEAPEGASIWFPMVATGPNKKKRQLVGPVADLNLYWILLKSSPYDPSSPEFKKTAKVTAFGGSIFARLLPQQGYDFVEGSADHNRLASMLMLQKVDAIYSADFRTTLNTRMRQRINDTIRLELADSMPVYFYISESLYAQNPDMKSHMTKALAGCV